MAKIDISVKNSNESGDSSDVETRLKAGSFSASALLRLRLNDSDSAGSMTLCPDFAVGEKSSGGDEGERQHKLYQAMDRFVAENTQVDPYGLAIDDNTINKAPQ